MTSVRARLMHSQMELFLNNSNYEQLIYDLDRNRVIRTVILYGTSFRSFSVQQLFVKQIPESKLIRSTCIIVEQVRGYVHIEIFFPSSVITDPLFTPCYKVYIIDKNYVTFYNYFKQTNFQQSE